VCGRTACTDRGGGGWKRSEEPDHGHWGGTTVRETGGNLEGSRTYRREKQPRQSPTLLTFRQRRARSKNGKQFNSFNPAISKPALKKISAEVRSWRLHNRIGQDFVGVARDINPIVRGWMNYYGAFNRSAMYPLLQRINSYLIRWIRNKYRRLRAKRKAFRCWRGIVQRFPRMFAHWKWTASAPAVW